MIPKKTVKTMLKPVDIKHMDIPVEGVSPLLIHKFSDEAMQAIKDKHAGNVIVKNKNLTLEEKIRRCIHKMDDGTIGFPVSGFHKGMVECAPYLQNVSKKLVKGAVKIIGDKNSPLMTIKYKKMTPQEDHAPLPMVAGNITARPRFDGWNCKLHVQFNASQISAEQIVNLLNLAGFHMGLGDWRPSSPKSAGSYGMYKVPETGKKKS